MEMHHSHHSGSTPGESAPPEPAARHGMAVFGVKSVYFSHLPMFMSPHDYQFIVQGQFADADAAALYSREREAHAGQKLYTFNPNRFVLPDLLPGANDEPPRSHSFSGTLFRNHFEQPEAHPEAPVALADDVVVNVVDVVHGHKFDPEASALERLEYLLFGRGAERFIAHLVTRPPDFDQLLSVGINGRAFSDDDLTRGIPLKVADRPNRHDDRLKEGDSAVAATVNVDGSDEPIELEAVSELYVETNDLKEAM
jgi:hypothetical protein